MGLVQGDIKRVEAEITAGGDHDGSRITIAAGAVG